MHELNQKKYNRIKAALAEAGVRNSELATYMGVHASTVSDWCTNNNQPSIQDFYKIADFLQIDVCLLLHKEKKDSYAIEEKQSHLKVAEPRAPYHTKSSTKQKPARGKKK